MMRNHEFPEQTCKTSETCGEVKNSQFIDAVFHSKTTGSEPFFVSFEGNPNTVSANSWNKRPKDVDNVGGNNNFFSLSSFFRKDDGILRRRKADFSSLHAIMLDDIGSKIDRSKLLLPPSWLIKTSPGNFQAGYILDIPVKDANLADQLMKEIIAAGLSDPGAGGPTARLARLPVGSNGKHNGNPSTELHVWEPSLHYSIDEIAAAYELDMTPQSNRRQADSRNLSQADNILIPAPKTNPVVEHLKKHGLYKADLGEGKHDVTCPWVDEHTAGIDHASCYFEPNALYPTGGFSCLHSHGPDLSIRNLLEYLQLSTEQTRIKPTIRFRPGMLDAIVTNAEQILSATSEIFQINGMVVTIETDKVSREVSTTRLGPTQIVRKLDQVAHWEQCRTPQRGWVPMDPPEKIADQIYRAGKSSKIPPLLGVARQPFLRDDGSLVTANGYDELSCIYGAFNPSEYQIKSAPSHEDAQLALSCLRELLSEVPFASPEDESAALSALLTAAIRPSLPLAPGFHAVAHSIGSGKSFLMKIISTFATSQHVPGIAFPSEKDEMNKTLVALLMKSPAVINFDDLNVDIYPSESLKMALTEEYLASRILGYSKEVTCSTKTLFLFSGNNVFPIRDMARRVISIHLDPQCETPATRVFKKPNLEQELRQNRGRLVSAAITIIQAWKTAGQPITDVKPIASFTAWSMLCRQPLLWLGVPDPGSRLFEQLQSDPDREILGRILHGWHQMFGSKAYLLRDAIPKLDNADPDLHEAIREVADQRGSVNHRMLGWWIKKHAGKIVDGFRFERCTGNRGAAPWRVSQVSKVSQDIDDEARAIFGYDVDDEDIL